MTVALYADVNFPGPVVKGLRQRNVHVLTAREDGCHQLIDEELLKRATELGRVLLTQDKDYFSLAKQWQIQSREFSGVLFTHHLHLSYRELIDELEIAALAGEREDFRNRMEVLPLRQH